jgi:hypothetical protein
MYLFSVALTVCSTGETANNGDVVKFPYIHSNYGIQNITLFQQTGIFICEQEGLYMFFSNIMSNSADGSFRWYLRYPNTLSGLYVGY